MTRFQTIALVGCGNLGGAMLRGWLKAGVKASFLVVSPRGGKKNARVTHLKNPDKRLLKAAAVILAVKPQIMGEVCASLKPFIAPDALVLSVAAGRSIKSFESIFGKNQPIVRCIPNLGAQAGKSMTPAIASKQVRGERKKLAETILKSIGEIDWLKSEDMMHAASAVTASGPGFLAHYMEAMVKAAQEAGFDARTAEKYVRQMVIGSAAAFESDPGLSPAQLRERVTSPNGMTEAGLKIMMAEMPRLARETLKAAEKRCRELGRG